ncbi:MAG: endonuclease/exonuclease/phosphatase family protein [Candidatus Hodarchaeota archaeon]
MSLASTRLKDQLDFLSPVFFDAVLVFIFLSQFERFLTMIFVLNFSTEGPNVTIILLLFLMTGFLELVLPWPHSQSLLTSCVLLVALMVLISFFPITIVATGGAILALIFITPVLVSRMQIERQYFFVAAVLGVLIQMITRVWLDTGSYYATILGVIFLLGWVVVGIVLWIFKVKDTILNTESPQREFIDIIPIFGFLIIQFLFLGFANVISTWFIRNYLLMSFSGILGLSIGVILVLERGSQIINYKYSLGWVFLYLISLSDLLWFNIIPIISYFGAQLSACIILYVGLNKNSIRSIRVIGLRLILIQFFAIIILFLEVSAGNWAFMPSFLEITRGQAAMFIFITGIFLPLSSLQLNVTLSRLEQFKSVKKSIRIIFLLLIVIMMTGVISREFYIPDKEPDSNSLRIMTYNIHQYFSVAQTGQYNLEQVRDIIRESGADVIGLEESEGARITSSNMNGVQWLAHSLGMNYYYGPPTSAQIYGVSLLSRFPIVNSRWIALPAEESIERVAVITEIDTGTLAGIIPIIVTHFQTSKYSEDRLAQAQMITELTRNLTTAIVMGDFNTRQDETDLTYILLNSTYSDAWLLAPGNDPSGGATAYSDNGVASKRIDYIWLKGSWTVHECTNFGTPRDSDHRAVYASLILSS